MAPRKQRSDAQQNRQRILTVAKEAFAKVGADASLEGIAKQAGVGPGTLYRHFPSREDLLKAVYQAAPERLAASADDFASTLAPVEALRAWMMLFVDFIADKQIIAPVLSALVGDPHTLYAASYGQIHEAVRSLVERAIKSGEIREDLDAIGPHFVPHLKAVLCSCRDLAQIGSMDLQPQPLGTLPISQQF